MRDIASQAIRAVTGRPTRSALTCAGVGLGIAAAITTIGVTASAQAAISTRFDALQATQVTLRYTAQASRPDPVVLAAVAPLNGIRQAGLLCQGQQQADVANASASDAHLQSNIFAAQPQALLALGASLSGGRFYDQGNSSRRDHVALLDSAASRDLGIANPTMGYSLLINGLTYEIIGTFIAPTDQPRLTNSVVIPYENCVDDATHRYTTFQQPEIDLRTALGAANQVAREARLAASPNNPAALLALVPPDLSVFRHGVEQATRTLFLGLAGVSLVIGALGISNTTLISVLERRGEIGLRRAIGATRRAIATQFLLESAMLGIAGGTVGTIIGIDLTASISLAQGWLVILDPKLIGFGLILGAATGAIAGLYPAWSATRAAPADTLRMS